MGVRLPLAALRGVCGDDDAGADTGEDADDPRNGEGAPLGKVPDTRRVVEAGVVRLKLTDERKGEDREGGDWRRWFVPGPNERPSDLMDEADEERWCADVEDWLVLDGISG
jgi:hypothetical protein